MHYTQIMHNFICQTCGVQFAPTSTPPSACPICEDERQFVPESGQAWTTQHELQSQHRNDIKQVATNLYSIKTTPRFAIGQQAHLIQTPEGNILWDCISFLDQATIEAIQKLGGIKTIAISHPHFYSSMIDWAEAFDAELLIHKADEAYVMQPSSRIQFWDGGRLELHSNLTLINSGGHFDGATVLHWPQGGNQDTNGNGALLTGDIIDVAADNRWLSFMYSFPNKIPLSKTKIETIVQSLDNVSFEKIYGAFGGIVKEDAKAAVIRSAERYIKAITD